MKKLANLFRKPNSVTAACLGRAENVGPTVDWSGPEVPLSKEQPIGGLICTLLEEAGKRNAGAITLSLDVDSERAGIVLQTPEGAEQLPALGGHLWSPLVSSLPRIASIESCQGVLSDPASGTQWQFTFTKADNRIVLTRL